MKFSCGSVQCTCLMRSTYILARGEQKNQKTDQIEKTRKKNRKNWTVKKNRLKFWTNRPVRFRFYKLETEKTEPNRKNRFFFQKDRTEIGRFEPVSVVFLIMFGYFLIKTEPNRKWSPLILLVIGIFYISTYKNNYFIL